jgi:hypothetical protein
MARKWMRFLEFGGLVVAGIAIFLLFAMPSEGAVFPSRECPEGTHLIDARTGGFTVALACVSDNPIEFVETTHEGLLACLVDKPEELEAYNRAFDAFGEEHGNNFLARAYCTEDCSYCEYHFEIPVIIGGTYCPCSLESGAGCVWSDEHQQYVRWHGCRTDVYGNLQQSAGACGNLEGTIPCSLLP